MTPNFVNDLVDMFKNKVVDVRVRDTGEYYNDDGELVREGFSIPRGKENDPFYAAGNLHILKERMKQFADGTGPFVHKTIEELEGLAK
jgi:hypothetical protein